MRERYERELQVLHEEILKMGLMVERALGDAMAAVKSGDIQAAAGVIEADREIDAAEARIEELCAMLIAREQPVAGDLRAVMAILKVSSELERMGDHARSLAEYSGRLGTAELAMALPSIEPMLSRILDMIKAGLEAFTEHDAKAALSVAEQDNAVDRLHDDLYRLLMNALGRGEGDPAKLVPLLFLNRFLERLGDRVTNMCEWVYYARKGERPEMNKGALPRG